MANRSRVLATGGGFIGRAMVSAPLAEGHEVTVTGPRVFAGPAVRSALALGAGGGMIYGNPADKAVDDKAIKAFIEAYGERATRCPRSRS